MPFVYQTDRVSQESEAVQSVREREHVEDICKRQRRLEDKRKPFDALWDDVDESVIGRRAVYDIGNKTGNERGSKTGAHIYDQTAAMALQDFVDGYQGNSAAPTIKWWAGHFRNKQLMELHEAQQWFDDVEEAVTAEVNASNFYSQIYEATWDRVAYGPSHIYGPEWDTERSRLVYMVRHPREVFYALNSWEDPDLWHRKFMMSARQILADYPDAKLSKELRKRMSDDPYQEFAVIHAIYKRSERDTQKVTGDQRRWASDYVMSEEKVLLEQSGYDEAPITTSRWRQNPGEPYPRSLAIDSIYEIMMVNQMSRSVLRAAQLLVEPPYLIWGTLKGKLKIVPSGQTTLENPTDKAEPLAFPSQLGAGLQQISDVRAALGEKFKAKVFSLMSAMQGKVTATQVAAMQGEQATLLGPIVTRDQNENLVPLIHKTFAVLAKSGRIPTPPPSILPYANTPVDIQFMGPVAMLAKRYLQMQGVNAALGSILPMAKEFFPDMLDHINTDELFKYDWESSGAPARIMRDDKQVAQIRQMRQQQLQAQQKQQAAQNMADAYHKGTAAPEPGSMAAQLAGGGGQ